MATFHQLRGHNMGKARRLPGYFPVGTRYVIEGRYGQILTRYIAFPDGRRVDLVADPSSLPRARRRPHRSAGK
jgi:hypothetical protein